MGGAPVISMEILRSIVPQTSFRRKPVVASRNLVMFSQAKSFPKKKDILRKLRLSYR